MNTVNMPPEGTVITHEGRAYTFLNRPVEHRTRDDRLVLLYRWLARCEDCEDDFTVRSVAPEPNTYFPARCSACAVKAHRALKRARKNP